MPNSLAKFPSLISRILVFASANDEIRREPPSLGVTFAEAINGAILRLWIMQSTPAFGKKFERVYTPQKHELQQTARVSARLPVGPAN